MTNELPSAQDHQDADTPTMEQFLAMVRDYVAQVERAHALLCQYLALAQPMDWRSAGIPQSGRCGPHGEIEYFFHGIGCEVKTDGLWVDWDYGAGGRTDGFDEWRLHFFTGTCTDRYPEFRDRATLQTAWQMAIACAVIKQSYADHFDTLYYLPEAHEPNSGS